MTPDESHFRKLERMYQSAPINRFFQPFLTVSAGAAELRMVVRPDFHHAAGAVHGSVYFKALDDAAYFAVNSLVSDVFVLTVSFNVYFVRPVTDGRLIASGRVVHRSQNLFVADSEVVDRDGKAIARGSGTFMKSRTALTGEIGYQ